MYLYSYFIIIITTQRPHLTSFAYFRIWISIRSATTVHIIVLNMLVFVVKSFFFYSPPPSLGRFRIITLYAVYTHRHYISYNTYYNIGTCHWLECTGRYTIHQLPMHTPFLFFNKKRSMQLFKI